MASWGFTLVLIGIHKHMENAMIRKVLLTSSAIAGLTLGAGWAAAQQSASPPKQTNPPVAAAQTDQGTAPSAGASEGASPSADEDLLRRKKGAKGATGGAAKPPAAAQREEPGKGVAGQPATTANTSTANGTNAMSEEELRKKKPGAGQPPKSANTGTTGTTQPPKAATGTTNTNTANAPATGQPAKPAGTATANAPATGQPPKATGTATANAPAGQPSTAGTSGPATTTTANAGVEGRFKLDPQRASSLHDRLVRTGGEERTDVNVNLSIGMAIPETVRVRELPPEIVTEYPEFRGYDYVVVRDEIIIVEPRTKKVVEVIGRGGSRRAAAVGGTGTAATRELRLTREQREIIRRDIHPEESAAVEFTGEMGGLVPDTVTLAPIPQVVISEVPMVQSYDYVVTRDHHIVIVDPNTREVLDVID
ncbi:MAG: DUF1236 domain-containing protein [Methylobacteriaceae bacterium]|nr:DUF1236 domain-containing protein [Methylobacteriaceae bacterium]